MNRLALVLAVVVPMSAGAAPQATDDEPAPGLAKKKAKAKPKAKRQPDKKKQKEPEPEIEMDPVVAQPPPPPEPAPPKPDVAVAAAASVDVSLSVKPREKIARRFYVRAGIARVMPLTQSRELELADVDGAASLAIDNGPIEGSGASVGSATIPAVILGYKLTTRWSLETIVGMPFTVKLKATGTAANESLAPMALGIPTGVPPLGEQLGEAKAAPPVLTLVYQLRTHGALRPYAGAGLGVLFAFDAHVTNPILTAVDEPKMTIPPAPGIVLQTGAEARLSKRIYARLDVKFIALMLARAKVEHVQVATPELPVFESVEVGTAKADVWVNPLIVQLGVGTDF